MKKITVQYVGNDVDNKLRWDVMRPGEESMLAAVKALKDAKGYVTVAEVEYDDKFDVLNNLEQAYKMMQNGVVTDSWTLMPPDGLTALVDPIMHEGQQYGHRSASMGDLFTVDGKEYVVATFGFEEVT